MVDHPREFRDQFDDVNDWALAAYASLVPYEERLERAREDAESSNNPVDIERLAREVMVAKDDLDDALDGLETLEMGDTEGKELFPDAGEATFGGKPKEWSKPTQAEAEVGADVLGLLIGSNSYTLEEIEAKVGHNRDAIEDALERLVEADYVHKVGEYFGVPKDRVEEATDHWQLLSHWGHQD